MITKGYLYNLVIVTDMDAEVLTLHSVLVVYEFRDIFPNYLSGIPPNRVIYWR